MSERTKVKALLSVNMFVDCPACKEDFDLMDVQEFNEEAGGGDK